MNSRNTNLQGATKGATEWSELLLKGLHCGVTKAHTHTRSDSLGKIFFLLLGIWQSFLVICCLFSTVETIKCHSLLSEEERQLHQLRRKRSDMATAVNPSPTYTHTYRITNFKLTLTLSSHT